MHIYLSTALLQCTHILSTALLQCTYI